MGTENYNTFNWIVHKYWSKGDITKQHITLRNVLCIRNSITAVTYVFPPRSFPPGHLRRTHYCTVPWAQFTTFCITVLKQPSSYKPIPGPRCLRRGCAAARFLGMRIRIPPCRRCPSLFSAVCCQLEVSATGRSFVQRSPSECGVPVCDFETSTRMRPRPLYANQYTHKHQFMRSMH